MPEPEIPEGEVPEDTGTGSKKIYIIGAAVVAAILGFIFYRKHKKKKMDESLNIDI